MESSLERLVQLVDAEGIEGVEKWRDERRQAVAEQASRVGETTLYYVGLLGTQKVRGRMGNVRTVERIINTFGFTYDELPNFARVNGLDKDELQAVCELRQRSVSAKGKTF